MKSDEEYIKDYKVAVLRDNKICICPKCEGSGVTYKEVCASYHRGEYDYIPEECFKCSGFGLVKEGFFRVVAVDKYGRVHTPEHHIDPYNPKANPEYEAK